MKTLLLIFVALLTSCSMLEENKASINYMVTSENDVIITYTQGDFTDATVVSKNFNYSFEVEEGKDLLAFNLHVYSATVQTINIKVWIEAEEYGQDITIIKTNKTIIDSGNVMRRTFYFCPNIEQDCPEPTPEGGSL